MTQPAEKGLHPCCAHCGPPTPAASTGTTFGNGLGHSTPCAACTPIPPAESCLCRDPLREVHPGCSLHGHSPESVFPPDREGSDQP